MSLLLSKLSGLGTQGESILIVKLELSLSDVFCPSRLPFPLLSVFLKSLPFPPPPLCVQSPCTCLSSFSLSLLPMSFNSIKGQGPTPLPLHPHLLSLFFSRWCNSAVRCRGHHKLTRSLITVDLVSGEERGREWGAPRETLRKTETESSSSYLPGNMVEWMRGGTNSSGGRRHHHHKR